MNERIKELALEAKLGPALLLYHYWGKIDALTDSEQEDLEKIEKFAQLIVRECMQACINMGNEYEIKSAGQYQAELFAFAIKQHFGVEEPKGWICPKCGADRTKIACPLGFGATVDGRCPMTVEAQ